MSNSVRLQQVASIGPSLATKDHSHEQSVIPSILKRGYYHPQTNVRPSSLSSIVDVSLIITPSFLGSFISSTYSPFVQGGFMSPTRSSFFRRGSIICSPITFPPCEESPSELHQACRGNTRTSFEIEAWLVYQQLTHRYPHTGA